MPTFTDAIQRPIQIAQPPQRIVSLVPSITETLFAFGAGEAVAGVTNFCVEPRGKVEGKPKVGGTKTLDIARVKELAPDLVIANAEENRQEDVRQLIAGGLTVFITFPRTVTHAIAMMRQIAEMTDTLATARPFLEDAEQTLAETSEANARQRPLRMLCTIRR